MIGLLLTVLSLLPHVSGADGSLSVADRTDDDSVSPYRGKVLQSSPSIDTRELWEAYRDLRDDYHDKTSDDEGWTVLSTRQGVQVALLEHPDDPLCPYIRIKGRISVPVQDCWDFLQVERWEESLPQIDPFFEGVEVYGEYNISVPEEDWQPTTHNTTLNATAGACSATSSSNLRMFLCRKRTKRILAFDKRDLVFLSVSEDQPLPDGTWVSGTVSVQVPGIFPRQAGYTRAFQDSVSFYRPVHNNTETELTMVCRLDLNDSSEDGQGGFIPMWLYVKTIGRTGAQTVIRMRQALMQEGKRAKHCEG